MSLPAVDLPERALTPAGDWHPTRYTPPLAGAGEDFPTQGDKLLRFADRHWRVAEAARFVLDCWQRWLIRHVLEVYPPDWPVAELRGQLRYRQVVISLGRQNGKSLIAALLAFYFLAMHLRGPRVAGFASIESQSKIVYDRVKFAVENNPALSFELRATATRGIWRRDGSGVYFTMPAKEDSAQGEPFSGAIYDELHLGLLGLWDAIVLGQSSKTNSLLVGITTAGDADSELLIKLYSDGEAALNGDDERFGFFVWEAADEELTEANVVAANPAIACGRLPLDQRMTDARKMWRAPRDKDGVLGRDRVIRYTLNRFVRGSAATWAPLDAWDELAGAGLPERGGGLVFGVDRHEWESATITAAIERDGRLYTEVVASLVDTSHDELLALCFKLAAAHTGAAFAVDAVMLAALAKALREAGHEVYCLTAGEMHQAAAGALGAIHRRGLVHAGDKLLDVQMPRAKRVDSGDTWRISRSESSGEIDSVIATVLALYVADIRADKGIQLF